MNIYILYAIIIIVLIIILIFIKNTSNLIVDNYMNNMNDLHINYFDNTNKNKIFDLFTPYLNLFKNPNSFNSIINLKARNFANYKMMEDFYITNGLQFISNIERDTINTYIISNLEKLKTDSPRLYNYIMKLLPQIEIAKGHNKLESGMPHTHSNVMIMPQNWFDNPSFETFIHEIVHIDQRLNSEKWNKMLLKLGFEHKLDENIFDFDYVGKMEKLYKYNRINPDGLDLNYIWKMPILETSDKNWLCAIYNSDNPQSLRDVRYIIYDLQTGEIDDIKNDHNSIYYYLDYMNNNNYHPNEITAELMVQYYNHKRPTNLQDHLAYDRFYHNIDFIDFN